MFDEVADLDFNKLHVPGTAKDFHLMAHQLADAYAMFRTEQSPLPTTILGNDVGLGKTSIFLAVCAMGYQNCLRFAREGLDFEAWPTIMFEPANLVAQVFGEVTDLWGKYFKVIVVQGDAKSHGGNARLGEGAMLRLRERPCSTSSMRTATRVCPIWSAEKEDHAGTCFTDTSLADRRDVDPVSQQARAKPIADEDDNQDDHDPDAAQPQRGARRDIRS
jgi:hypothetical protein